MAKLVITIEDNRMEMTLDGKPVHMIRNLELSARGHNLLLSGKIALYRAGVEVAKMQEALERIPWLHVEGVSSGAIMAPIIPRTDDEE